MCAAVKTRICLPRHYSFQWLEFSSDNFFPRAQSLAQYKQRFSPPDPFNGWAGAGSLLLFVPILADFFLVIPNPQGYLNRISELFLSTKTDQESCRAVTSFLIYISVFFNAKLQFCVRNSSDILQISILSTSISSNKDPWQSWSLTCRDLKGRGLLSPRQCPLSPSPHQGHYSG